MKLRTSDKAWLTLVVGILAYETVADYDELLSCAVDRYLNTHPWVTRTIILTTAAHLLNVLPGWLDPWHGFGLLMLRTQRGPDVSG